MKARPPLPPGPFLVAGLARSGEAAALALRARGEAVIGVDSGAPEGLGRLRAAGVEVHPDALGDQLVTRARTLVKSPGVPSDAPVARAARAAGLVVCGELEIAWRLLGNEFVAVTGTNGKTTTVELLGHIHRAAGAPVAVAGNVGTALSSLVGSVKHAATVVCETSSFQLEDSLEFAPEAMALLNIEPDHLDRHGTMDAYRAAKLRGFANQGAADVAVLPAELDAGDVPGAASRVRFGEGPEAEMSEREGALWWRGERLLGAGEVGIPGPHNRRNAMAAAAVALERGIDREAVAEGLRTFPGVAHRLEPVGERAGVRYVNDSKATNVASTLVALASFEGGVRLILGGVGKGQDFAPLAPAVARRASSVHLIGEAAGEIARALAGSGVPLSEDGDLESAVAAATALASPGDVVLLSPACASFDQFADFEARGDRFRVLAGGGA